MRMMIDLLIDFAGVCYVIQIIDDLLYLIKISKQKCSGVCELNAKLNSLLLLL